MTTAGLPVTRASEVREAHRAIDLMQEAAMVLSSVDGRGNTATGDYRMSHLNDNAARALGAEVPELVDRVLSDILPADTAAALCELCDEALRSNGAVHRNAAAPDSLTDLSRTPSIAVRATRIDNVVLCTWTPGWTSHDARDRRPLTTAGSSVADRLELAATLDALADTGFGVFFLDLMSDRLLWSKGMYKIFGRDFADGPIDAAELRSRIVPIVAPTGAWAALLHDGVPLDIEIRLQAQFGGGRIRIIATTSLGADGYPVAVHGRCCAVLD